MKVLIADDSVAHARQLGRLLRELGHETVGHAANGGEAVKLYSTAKPDLVLMDIVMPGMDGLSALRVIRAQDATARVVVLSSLGGVGDRVDEALRLGALRVLAKPVSKEDLRRELVEVM